MMNTKLPQVESADEIQSYHTFFLLKTKLPHFKDDIRNCLSISFI